MSHVKAGGSSKNNRNNAGRRLGVKRFGGQTVSTGEVLVRQSGSTKVAGPGTFISKDFTIHAQKDGIVSFKKIRKTHFTGRTVPRTQVAVQ
ncbi:MAG: ribosomal protein [Candidatus Saccharibacteria bacterium]|nr:ribosomal protein [Candidatus Saccharibacteria bacterium]